MAHPTNEWVEFFDPDGEAKYAQDGFVYTFRARAKPRDGYDVGYLYKCEARECKVEIRFDEKDGYYEIKNQRKLRRKLHQHPPDYSAVAAQIAESKRRTRNQRGNKEKSTGNFRTDDRSDRKPIRTQKWRNQRKVQANGHYDDEENKENNTTNSNASRHNNNSHLVPERQQNRNPTKAKKKRRNRTGNNSTTILQTTQQDPPENSAGTTLILPGSNYKPTTSQSPKKKTPISRTNGVCRKNPNGLEKGATSIRQKVLARSAATTRPTPPVRPPSPRQKLARTTPVVRPVPNLACRPGPSGFISPRPPSSANSSSTPSLPLRPVPSAPPPESRPESPRGCNFFNDQQQIRNDEAYARLLSDQWASEIPTAPETQLLNAAPVPQTSPVVSQPSQVKTNFFGQILNFVFRRSTQPLHRADLLHIYESECVICFEAVQDEVKCQCCKQVIGCQDCVQRWIRGGSGNGSCPLCRGAIRNRYF